MKVGLFVCFLFCCGAWRLAAAHNPQQIKNNKPTFLSFLAALRPFHPSNNHSSHSQREEWNVWLDSIPAALNFHPIHKTKKFFVFISWSKNWFTVIISFLINPFHSTERNESIKNETFLLSLWKKKSWIGWLMNGSDCWMVCCPLHKEMKHFFKAAVSWL